MLLREVLAVFDFFDQLSLVYLEGYSITGGQVLYYGKQYQGVHPQAFQLQTDSNLPIKKAILLFKQGNTLHHLDLSPILVCTNVSNSEKEISLCVPNRHNMTKLGF